MYNFTASGRMVRNTLGVKRRLWHGEIAWVGRYAQTTVALLPDMDLHAEESVLPIHMRYMFKQNG